MANPRRSLLFTPATRPDRFAKAAASGADIVCVDLEDAVAPQEKDGARAEAIAWLTGAATGERFERAVRINALTTRAGLLDLAALADARPASGLVFLPKVETPGEVRVADAILSEAGATCTLGALIESGDGLDAVHDIAAASRRLRVLLFGAVDFSADLGLDLSPGPLAYARGRLVHAARRAGCSLLDVPSLDFRDNDAVAAEAEAARAMGFTGKAAIHPANVAAINAVFTPSVAEVAEAARVLAAFDAMGTGVAVLDGKLIEAPVVRTMRARLEAARAAGMEVPA
ncbi:CoA ester lyase [Acuticoccus sediminis]|uniref:CoA ester lyase n=1 Tax=Acuticoccus sediminis TaxID=2184697 RepID=A0A8B2NPS5_9HYPH|nr:CoA ester lyase [Acuticoccus sediminis]RAH97783.1 CoA ester lyase [Acuticoccus sediminis]